MEKLMTLTDVSEKLQLTKTTIYNMIYRKEIPYVKIGGSYRFKQDEINNWIEEGVVNGTK